MEGGGERGMIGKNEGEKSGRWREMEKEKGRIKVGGGGWRRKRNDREGREDASGRWRERGRKEREGVKEVEGEVEGRIGKERLGREAAKLMERKIES